MLQPNTLVTDEKLVPVDLVVDPKKYFFPSLSLTQHDELMQSGSLGIALGIPIHKPIERIAAPDLQPEEYETIEDFVGNNLRDLAENVPDLGTARQFFGGIAIMHSEEGSQTHEIFLSRKVHSGFVYEAGRLHNVVAGLLRGSYDRGRDSYARIQPYASRSAPARGSTVPPGLFGVLKELGAHKRDETLATNLSNIMKSQVELSIPSDMQPTRDHLRLVSPEIVEAA